MYTLHRKLTGQQVQYVLLGSGYHLSSEETDPQPKGRYTSEGKSS